MQPTSNSEHITARPFPNNEAAPPRPRQGWLSRTLLPVVLFVAIVAAIAWMVQNMPKWQGPATVGGDPPAAAGGEPVLEFTNGVTATWSKNPDEVKEWEFGVSGYYDFPFRNVASTEAELGLLQPSCDCVDIKAAVLPITEWYDAIKAMEKEPGTPVKYAKEPAWQVLETNKGSLSVPVDGRGLVRVAWSARKDPGRPLNLTPKFWSGPKGKPALRNDKITLTVPITISQVVNMAPTVKLGLGTLNSGDKTSVKLFFWSTLRDDVQVEMKAVTPDPLVDVELKRVPPEEFSSFLAEMERTEQHKVQSIRCAYTATLTVHERKGSKEMDLGPFLRNFRTLVEGQPVDSLNFQVYGLIRSAVEVGGSEEPGKIKLRSFSVRQGTRQLISLWCDAKIDLELHEHIPAGLEVKLNKMEKESTPARAKWRLELVVPPDTLAPGTLSEDSAIVLRMPRTNPPRLVRIPIIGHADAD
jgi:hypothetical protein